ncbi:MAG: hypothetical protein JGK24_11455 [Microcoleus sp. PH2017_29_MFU_D_A]|jgi:hypothetical protein|uniref:hypothetical protein n=1 Tax=unclassified Microcoleus TaxID=2642155 RepID=UPI001D434ABE|nr:MULTISPECIES: hypothetical protein [unclassified Microcoleus]MCC3422034.1 hypothetical protein [Microcoleus sp. PH2017_07_MST_O_A]MCC3432511.1 hypothetical protein [Microcoleus sp. PH2017_04_SCI_O_A]MCC3442472.1 hypothetical protein [Microcoleus sp. PH2017_03_ELD_O_A]MCC3464613.1 hypothetical protein [Microcoleus sp. PH2017_06_SFM_O_A]MCC3503668.1 hypothetical protein [Microcoleus sp. PH2017_19_SFW_U_A]MCC3511396.1 hypothetical protein [Microcoleus sp. PH2017_17_BER_D_A]TAE09927.1 MAG: hy
MSTQIILVEPRLAVASPKPKQAKPGSPSPDQILMGASGLLLLLLLGLAVFTKLRLDDLSKKLKFEEFRNRELQKKYKMALETISKMEKNPDLIHSRDFNLDYLRMRMAEEVFHFAIVNQIKVKVKDKISIALRPTQSAVGDKNGTAGSGRQVDSMFDIEYETGDPAVKIERRVLFRIQIKLMKLPTQATSATINQIIDCLETYLSPSDDHDSWQPTIQGRIVHIEWDQKAKPTPMLVLEQSNEGVNVTFRTTRTPAGRPANENESQLAGAKGQKNAKSSSKSAAKGGTKSPAKVGAKRPGSRK